ncbi:MAG: flagellar hook-length control protein FliK, partial [Siculibacillus sp.]
PFHPLVWLANAIARAGRFLRAGDIVTTGAYGGGHAIRAGSRARGRVEGLGARALERTEGALQRILLEQYAVLDTRGDDAAATAEVRAQQREWTAELPLATATGTSIVQMTVERDAPEAGATAASSGWRVRFALDVEPIGPVHAQIGLAGEHLSIGLWVERADMAARLADEVGQLRGALEAAAIPVEAIHLSTGAPPTAGRAATAGSGRFIDVSL